MESDEEATVLSYTHSSTFSESDCFRFEPQRSLKAERQHTTTSSSSTDSVPVASASSSDVPVIEEPPIVRRSQRSDSNSASEWCRCGKCDTAYLVTEKEYVCCHEIQDLRNFTEGDGDDTGRTCVTNNPGFARLCLEQLVLRNVLVALVNIRLYTWKLDPPSNRSLRWAAYRQFTWWVHGKLGRRHRRVIPACTTHVIRSTVSKSEGEVYEGYSSGADNDTD